MNIDNQTYTHMVGSGGAEPVTALEDRMPKIDGVAPDETSNPEFDLFYNALHSWLTTDQWTTTEILDYVKAYEGSDGERPFNTAQSQMDVLALVMETMDEPGPEHSSAYNDLEAAFATAFSNNFFVMQFSQEIFKPADEDDRSKMDW